MHINRHTSATHAYIHINKHIHKHTLTLPQTDIRIPSKSDFFINKYILRRQRGAPTHSRPGEQVSERTHVCESASCLRSQWLHSLSPLSIAALSHRFTLLRSQTPPRQGIVCDRAKEHSHRMIYIPSVSCSDSR